MAAITQIQSILTTNELRIIPILVLARLPAKERLAFCDNVRSNRIVRDSNELHFGPDNEFLSGLEVLMLRGVSIQQFFQLDKEKQRILATDGLTFRFMNIGIQFERLSKLNANDLTGIYSWIRNDVNRVMGLYKDHETSLAQEIS